MLNIKKTIGPVLLLSLIIQCGCASLGAHDRSREKIEFSVDDLTDGNIRLVCGVNCYVTYLQMRGQLKELYDNQEWLDLARKVSEIGYELDLAYYYLGRASEVLESYDAARTYYDHALAAPKCVGFITICNGFEFPGDIKTRLVLIARAEKALALKKQKSSREKEKIIFTEEQILYEEVKKIPAKYVEKNRDGYKKLLEINPINQTYKSKYLHYKNLSESKDDTANTKLSESQENTTGNKQLVSTTETIDYNLSENPNNAHDKGIFTSSSINEHFQSNSFAEALESLETAGAFTKDREKSSTLVETSFWNAMNPNQKKLFCYMLQTTYPMYAQSILDKHSGRKLAGINTYRELDVIQ